MKHKHIVKWNDLGREPKNPPDPNYPDGIDVGPTIGDETCKVMLPYPARRCGYYHVRCTECGQTAAVTTAGRVDDPRSVTLPCLPHIRYDS